MRRASDALLERRETAERRQHPAEPRADRRRSAREPPLRDPGGRAAQEQHRGRRRRHREQPAAKPGALIPDVRAQHRRRHHRELASERQRDDQPTGMAVELVEELAELARTRGGARDVAGLREGRLGPGEQRPHEQREGEAARDTIKSVAAGMRLRR